MVRSSPAGSSTVHLRVRWPTCFRVRPRTRDLGKSVFRVHGQGRRKWQFPFHLADDDGSIYTHEQAIEVS